MAKESQLKREAALEFLDELDGRHEFLLSELEQLNARLDAVLNDYTKSRQSAAQVASGPPMEASIAASLAVNSD
jgi:hypothetical protein